jgi:hypothetical protein
MYPIVNIEKQHKMIRYVGNDLAYHIMREYIERDKLQVPNEVLLVALKPFMCNFHHFFDKPQVIPSYKVKIFFTIKSNTPSKALDWIERKIRGQFDASGIFHSFEPLK